MSDPQPIATVDVHFGDETKSFPVHKNFLTHYSPFFKKALDGNFLEGQTQTVNLHDTKPRAFGLFLGWIHTQKVENEHGLPPRNADLIHLWILADKLLIPALQNEAIQIMNSTNCSGVSSSFPTLYENTMQDSPLRRFWIDAFAASSRTITTPRDYPPEMLVAVVNAMKKQRGQRPVKRLSKEEIKRKYGVSEEIPSRS